MILLYTRICHSLQQSNFFSVLSFILLFVSSNNFPTLQPNELFGNPEIFNYLLVLISITSFPTFISALHLSYHIVRFSPVLTFTKLFFTLMKHLSKASSVVTPMQVIKSNIHYSSSMQRTRWYNVSASVPIFPFI